VDLVGTFVGLVEALAGAAPPDAPRARDFLGKVRALYRGEAGAEVRAWIAALDAGARAELFATALDPFALVPIVSLDSEARREALSGARSLAQAVEAAAAHLENRRASRTGTEVLALLAADEVREVVEATHERATRAMMIASSSNEEDDRTVAEIARSLGPEQGPVLLAAVHRLRSAAYDAGHHVGSGALQADGGTVAQVVDAPAESPTPPRRERRSTAARDRRARRKR
jgi:hypothetical protein